MKNLVKIGLLVFAMLWPNFATLAQESARPNIQPTFQPFVDVGETHRYARAIATLKEEGIVEGFPIGTFLPERPVNRAETVKLLIETFANQTAAEPPLDVTLETSLTPLPFTDIEHGAWYENYIELAYEWGIVKGYDDNTFRPERSVNLAEALKMMFLVKGTEVDLTTAVLEIDPAFDVPAQAWFAPYLQYALDHSIIYKDRDGNLNPGRELTRGEIGELLFRLTHPGVYTGNIQYGKATFYADFFQNDGTASGESFDQGKLTAAHPTLPFGTWVRVTNLKSGATVEVIINDRGPYGDPERIIDLSKSAFEKIAKLSTGVIRVEVEVMGSIE